MTDPFPYMNLEHTITWPYFVGGPLDGDKVPDLPEDKGSYTTVAGTGDFSNYKEHMYVKESIPFAAREKVLEVKAWRWTELPVSELPWVLLCKAFDVDGIFR